MMSYVEHAGMMVVSDSWNLLCRYNIFEGEKDLDGCCNIESENILDHSGSHESGTVC
jgi:hypothetical protein